MLIRREEKKIKIKTTWVEDYILKDFAKNGARILISGEEDGMGKASSRDLTDRNINKETLCKHETNFGSQGYPVNLLHGLHSNDSFQS